MTAFLNQFKPTILFLTKFVGLYLVLSLVYGLYVEFYTPAPDPVTVWVTNQTSGILNMVGWENTLWPVPNKPTIAIVYQGNGIISVYEGCNGINVAIILVCFLVSFGKPMISLVWFIPLSLVVLHVFNLARIVSLFYVAIFRPDYVYLAHKYLFTSVIYLAVFVVWFVWVKIQLKNKLVK